MTDDELRKHEKQIERNQVKYIKKAEKRLHRALDYFMDVDALSLKQHKYKGKILRRFLEVANGAQSFCWPDS